MRMLSSVSHAALITPTTILAAISQAPEEQPAPEISSPLQMSLHKKLPSWGAEAQQKWASDHDRTTAADKEAPAKRKESFSGW